MNYLNSNEKILYIYKSADELTTFVDISEDSFIVTLHASQSTIDKFPNCLLLNEVDFSNKTLNSTNFKRYVYTAIKSGVSCIWSFFPIEWIDSLRVLGVKVLNPFYNLYRYYDCKINSSYFLKQINSTIKLNIDTKEEILSTEYIMGEELTEIFNRRLTPFVVSEQFSSGGNGVYHLKKRDELKSMNFNPKAIYMVEDFISEVTNVNQSVIIFGDGLVVLAPTEQIIFEYERKLKYSGTRFNIENEVSTRISILTKHIANAMKISGVRGLIGIDYFIISGEILISEINPRYQGSALFLEICYEDKFSVFEANYFASIERSISCMPQDCLSSEYLSHTSNNVCYRRYYHGNGDHSSFGYSFSID